MKRKATRAFALLVALAFIAPVATATQADELRDALLQKPALSIEDLFRLAELGNPALAAAHGELQAREGFARQAGLWRNPSLELEVEDMSTEDTGDRAEKVGIGWPLELGGRRGHASAAARASRDASAHDYERARRETLLRVHELWAGQLFYKEAIPLTDDFIARAERTQEIAETRFSARAIPEAQVTKAQLELYEYEVARRQLERDRIREGAELTALLGGYAVNSERLAGSLADGVRRMDLNAMHSALAAHPANLASASERDAAAASLSAARAERIPDLDLMLAYGKSRPTDDSFLEFSVSLPLPLFDRGQGNVAAERARVDQAEQRRRSAGSEVEVAFDAALDRYASADERLSSLRSRIVPAATRGLEQAQDAYRAGRLSFLELIEARSIPADIRLRALELERELAMAAAELNSMAGTGPYGEKD